MKILSFKRTAFLKFPLVLLVAGTLASCNKELPVAEPIKYPDTNPVATTLGQEINTNADYSFYKTAVNRMGKMATLLDSSKVWTLLVPNNAAFIASGITSEAMISAMPIANVGGIVQYSMIPGQQYTSAQVPETFPNMQLPTSVDIGVLPGTTVPLKMTVFLSKRGTSLWANTMPIVKPDNKFRNGVIQVVGGVVAPASQLLKDAMYSNPDLAYFKEAVARADSGQVGLARLDSLLGYGVTNMTVLAPNNKAFHDMLFGAVYMSLVGQGVPPEIAAQQAEALVSTPQVFQNPALFPVLTAATVKGLLAYHFLATSTPEGYQPNIRVFSNNFATTPTYYKTLVNAGISVHPGLLGVATFAPGSPFVADLKFTGMGGGAAGPFSGAPATAVGKDKFAINGVYHVIDQVLQPQ